MLVRLVQLHRVSNALPDQDLKHEIKEASDTEHRSLIHLACNQESACHVTASAFCRDQMFIVVKSFIVCTGNVPASPACAIV